MLQLQLFVEGTEVELYRDESITLTRSIQDVKDIEKIFTDFTRTFSVPASKINNKIFKHFYNYHVDGFDARRKKDAQLYINYKPFKKGKIKLEGVTLRNNEAKTYKITFFGNTVTLPDLLGEDRLANLTELRVFNFEYTDANITSYLTNGLDNNIGTFQINDAVIFPLITHTSRLTYHSNSDVAHNIYPSTGGSNDGVRYNELKPALRIDAIIRAIELHYDIEFSNDFFNSTNTAYYNLYLWLHTKPGGLFVDQVSKHQVKDYTLSVFSKIVNGLTIRNNYFKLDNIGAPRRNFDLTFKVFPDTSTTNYNLVIFQNGKEFRRFDNLTGDTKNGAAANTKYDKINVDTGEFSVYIETDVAEEFQLLITVDNKLFLSGKSTIKGDVSTFSGSEIVITQQIPEMKIIDFLTGLFKMFNLTAFIEDNGLIRVQTLDSFYASSTETHDFTPYVDAKESQIDTPIPYSQVDLSYKGTSTFLARNFTTLNNRDWGKIEYQSEQKPSFEGRSYKIELPFEHLLYERLTDANNGNLSNITWGWHVDDKEEKSLGEPLLFYPVTKSDVSIRVVKIGGSRTNITAPYMPLNTNGLWTTDSIEDAKDTIHFSVEFDEYNLKSNTKTLFLNYYESYIKDLFNLKKRITKICAYIPLSTSEKLSLADSIIIFDKVYRINKISTNFENNKSDLELVNILDDTVAPLNINALEIDTTTDDITTDDSRFTADRDNVTADGFIIPPESEPVPDTIISNEPDPTIDCEVTAPTISTGNHVGEASKITFKYNIDTYGTLCGQDRISEYGFLIANASSTLTASDDIDTLKADSNITVINVTRDIGEPSLTTGLREAVIDGLSPPVTRFGRFYARTNIDPNFDKADVISSVFQESTDVGLGATADSSLITSDNTSFTVDQGVDPVDSEPVALSETAFLARVAGFGSQNGGYNTIPTQQQIIDSSRVRCDTSHLVKDHYHNGAGELPVVGDKVKQGTTETYQGGSFSNSSSYGTATYFAYAIATLESTQTINRNTYTRGIINSFIVVKFSDAEVVARYDCETEILFDGMYLIEKSSTLLDNSQVSSLARCRSYEYLSTNEDSANYSRFVHDGSGTNPVVGDKIRSTEISGGDFSGGASSFPSAYLGETYANLDIMLTTYESYNEVERRGTMQVRVSDAVITAIYYCV